MQGKKVSKALKKKKMSLKVAKKRVNKSKRRVPAKDKLKLMTKNHMMKAIYSQEKVLLLNLHLLEKILLGMKERRRDPSQSLSL